MVSERALERARKCFPSSEEFTKGGMDGLIKVLAWVYEYCESQQNNFLDALNPNKCNDQLVSRLADTLDIEYPLDYDINRIRMLIKYYKHLSKHRGTDYAVKNLLRLISSSEKELYGYIETKDGEQVIHDKILFEDFNCVKALRNRNAISIQERVNSLKDGDSATDNFISFLSKDILYTSKYDSCHIENGVISYIPSNIYGDYSSGVKIIFDSTEIAEAIDAGYKVSLEARVPNLTADLADNISLKLKLKTSKTASDVDSIIEENTEVFPAPAFDTNHPTFEYEFPETLVGLEISYSVASDTPISVGLPSLSLLNENGDTRSISITNEFELLNPSKDEFTDNQKDFVTKYYGYFDNTNRTDFDAILEMTFCLYKAHLNGEQTPQSISEKEQISKFFKAVFRYFVEAGVYTNMAFTNQRFEVEE